MLIEELLKIKKASELNASNGLTKIKTLKLKDMHIYPNSINESSSIYLFVGKIGFDKFLFLAALQRIDILDEFEGEIIYDEEAIVKQCPMNNSNSLIVQKLLSYTVPVLLGVSNSFGFGDRLGLANPAHLRSLKGYNFKPVLAQQSIRELTRTNRKPEDVMAAAVWAALQEGYKDGFGADADHLKTTDDIDLMINAGFTMFTIDPSDYVNNETDKLSMEELEEKLKYINWDKLNYSYDEMINKYNATDYDLGEGFVITPSKEDILRAVVKYGNAIAHIKYLYDYLNITYAEYPVEVEISVDETDSVTSPFEHFFLASELSRLSIKIISLAPRFVGDFEKGIDYKGDLDLFKKEYIKHILISEHFGSYKISLHSGSDKFGVYKTIGSLKRGNVHVKTAGTSYLEAIKVVATVEPDLFRKILDFSRIEYERAKLTYHVSADLQKVLPSENYSDTELVDLFNLNDARQVLHVTFGHVLTKKDDKGNFIFRDKIYDCLKNNEQLHYEYLIKHFNNHLSPFS